jgi:hypothetical protein
LPPAAPLFAPQPPGDFFEEASFWVEADLYGLYPYVSENLTAPLTRANGTMFQFLAPSARLDWTVSPYFEAGFRLPQNGAEFDLGYRFLNSEGTQGVVFNGTPDAVKSRLNLNIWDLDLGSSGVEVLPRWFFKWRLGLQVATAFYDTRAVNAMFVDHVSNYFVGAGPHGMLELRHQFLVSSFSAFGRIEGSDMVGQITQKFSENFFSPADSPLNAATEIKGTQSVPTLAAQLGLTWAPECYFRISTGLDWEKWWSLGRLQQSRMNLSEAGFFLRGEFDF